MQQQQHQQTGESWSYCNFEYLFATSVYLMLRHKYSRLRSLKASFYLELKTKLSFDFVQRTAFDKAVPTHNRRSVEYTKTDSAN